MAERLYTGLVSKQLRGDRDDALTLERVARTKVGYLFDSMMPLQTFKGGSWNLQDGRSITAFVWNDVLGKRATVRLVGVGGNPSPLPPLVSDAFMESGWTKVTNGTEEDFEAVIYPTNTQGAMVAGFPTWLDWIGEVYGAIENTRRQYYSGMPSLAMEYDKVVVSPTPQFLLHAVSGKLQMLAQAQYGTKLGVGTISLQDYLDDGGSVIRESED